MAFELLGLLGCCSLSLEIACRAWIELGLLFVVLKTAVCDFLVVGVVYGVAV